MSVKIRNHKMKKTRTLGFFFAFSFLCFGVYAAQNYHENYKWQEKVCNAYEKICKNPATTNIECTGNKCKTIIGEIKKDPRFIVDAYDKPELIIKIEANEKKEENGFIDSVFSLKYTELGFISHRKSCLSTSLFGDMHMNFKRTSKNCLRAIGIDRQ